jgi:hypothetical protein
MTRDYLEAEREYLSSHGMEKKLSKKDLPVDFPIEQARLRRLPWIATIFTISTAAYGVSLTFTSLTRLNGWIAVPLVLQFLIAASSNAIFALNSTLITDLCPGRGASATAMNNLVRGALSALGVAFVERMVADARPGAAFVGLAMVMLVVSPLVILNWYYGPTWRRERLK